MKYRTNIIMTLEFETAEADPKQFVRNQMDAVLPPGCEFSVINVSKIKPRVTVLGEFAPDQVFPFLAATTDRRDYTVGDKVYQVRMDSHRYHVFSRNPKCVACGLEGTKFLLELPPDAQQPHFNFYAVEHGQLILMTKDHIRSRAHGGEDRHDNYQTMCAICNCLKGSSRLTVEGVRELRRIYNECRRGASKRQMAARLRKAKQEMVLHAEPGERTSYSQKMRAIHLAEGKALKPCLVAKTDIIVGLDDKGRWFSMSAVQAKTRHAEGDITTVHHGSRVETTGNYRQRKVGIRLDGKEVFVYHGLLEYEDVWTAHEGSSGRVLRDDLPKSLVT